MASDEWVSAAPDEGVEYRLEDDHPEAMTALREAGYTGEVWLRVRCLTEAEQERRQSQAQFTIEGELGEVAGEQRAVIRIDQEKWWSFMWGTVVVDGRVPVLRDGKLVEYHWDQAKNCERKNVKVMGEARPALAAWAKEVGERGSAELPEQKEAVDEAGN